MKGLQMTKHTILSLLMIGSFVVTPVCRGQAEAAGEKRPAAPSYLNWQIAGGILCVVAFGAGVLYLLPTKSHKELDNPPQSSQDVEGAVGEKNVSSAQEK